MVTNTTHQCVFVFLFFWTLTLVVVMATDHCFDVFSAVKNGMSMKHHTYRKTVADSLHDCAAQCQMSAVCLSFSYDRRGQICHLNDNTAVADIVSRADFIYSYISVWPKSLSGPCSVTSCPKDTRCDVDRLGRAECVPEFQGCGEPPKVSGSVRKYDGHFLSAIAHYTCQSDYIGCSSRTTTSECRPAGQWERVSIQCEQFRWHNPISKKHMYVPCGARDRLKVTVIGKAATREKRTTIALRRGYDTLFLTDFRFRFSSPTRHTVINTKLRGRWGVEIYKRGVPLVLDEEYNLHVTLQDGVYTVIVDDAVYYRFKERTPGVKPEYFSISQMGPITLIEYCVSY